MATAPETTDLAADSWPLARDAKVYSWVMRYTQSGGRAPSVLVAAEGCGLGVLALAETVGGLSWLYLRGDPNNPARCFVEIDGDD